MRVLINAFACSPYRGSEAAVGWNIPRELAHLHEVTVLCGDLRAERPNWTDLTSYGLDRVPFRVAYVAPTRFISLLERLHRLPGCWILYYAAYNLWQRRAYRKARELQAEKPFDVVHQLNMIGYREPGYLWKLAVPFVWGPVGGAPNAPGAFLRLFTGTGRLKVGLRTLLNEVQKRLCLRARRAAKRARKIWAVTAADEEMIRSVWGRACTRMLEVGTDSTLPGTVHHLAPGEVLRIVWSGVHTSRKALPVLLHALARLPKGVVHVDILGEGPETVAWQKLAHRLGVEGALAWIGKKPRNEALDKMREAHVLACPSIKEASSVVVIEALSLGLPVVCHDACGMGTLVTETCGVKIPLRDPETSIAGFADALRRLLNRPEQVAALSRGALERAKGLTWAAKAAEISRGYEESAEGLKSADNADGHGRGAGYPCNPCKSVDKIVREKSADNADGHGKGAGYPCNPCQSVDKIDREKSADDADGHGRGTGYPCNPCKSVDKMESADNTDRHG
ncbi:MAG TPA: hypothetical protein DD637_06215 [Verrucomicrobia bacterium]|nr:hypothetical protein [Verrucomicrobiota bacterium]